ncbi:hypothetical protein [Streptomyces sp. NPDC001292]|uniref:hypothetical protein n=1 Tax=Streptomyces sp. NPDC001292 TaxID=3364558 RepID=UPI0036CE48AA
MTATRCRTPAWCAGRPPTGLSEAEVMPYVAERVAPYKRVRRGTFLDAVPRAASGKILRRRLRDQRPEQPREAGERP